MISLEGQKIVGEAFVDLTIYRLITSPEEYQKLWDIYENNHGYSPFESAKKIVKEFHNYESNR